jgi:hypothetical protein
MNVEQAQRRLSLFKQVKAILDEKAHKPKNYLEETDYWMRISELKGVVPNISMIFAISMSGIWESSRIELYYMTGISETGIEPSFVSA